MGSTKSHPLEPALSGAEGMRRHLHNTGRPSMAVQLQRRTFTVDDYHRMLNAGILTEDDRVELVCGEIVTMAPIGTRHASCVKGLNQLLTEGLGRRVVLGIQDPVIVGEHSEPQPDISVLRPRKDRYAQAHPTAADIFLLIEVSDTTLPYDRDIKVPMYGKAGVPESWLVDLAQRRVEVYRSPSPNGYGDLHYAYPGEAISPIAFPDISLQVDEVLG